MGNCLLLGFHAKWPLALPAFVVDICFDGSERDRIMGKQKKSKNFGDKLFCSHV